MGFETNSDQVIVTGSVLTFADLPDASTVNGIRYYVESSTGSWLAGSKKKAGIYKSDGSNWKYIGTEIAKVTADELTTMNEDEVRRFSPLDIKNGIINSLRPLHHQFMNSDVLRITRNGVYEINDGNDLNRNLTVSADCTYVVLVPYDTGFGSSDPINVSLETTLDSPSPDNSCECRVRLDFPMVFSRTSSTAGSWSGRCYLRDTVYTVSQSHNPTQVISGQTFFTGSRVMITDSGGTPSTSAVSSTELGRLDGVTENIQDALDSLKTRVTTSEGTKLTLNNFTQTTSDVNTLVTDGVWSVGKVADNLPSTYEEGIDFYNLEVFQYQSTDTTPRVMQRLTAVDRDGNLNTDMGKFWVRFREGAAWTDWQLHMPSLDRFMHLSIDTFVTLGSNTWSSVCSWGKLTLQACIENTGTNLTPMKFRVLWDGSPVYLSCINTYTAHDASSATSGSFKEYGYSESEQVYNMQSANWARVHRFYSASYGTHHYMKGDGHGILRPKYGSTAAARSWLIEYNFSTNIANSSKDIYLTASLKHFWGG